MKTHPRAPVDACIDHGAIDYGHRPASGVLITRSLASSRDRTFVCWPAQDGRM